MRVVQFISARREGAERQVATWAPKGRRLGVGQDASLTVTDAEPLTWLDRVAALRALSAGRRGAVQGWRSRLVRTGVATEPVLFDLQAHQLLLGEWVAEDLLQPDCVHPAFHHCCVVETHNRPLSSEAQEGSVRNASRRSAAVVTAPPDRQARARP
jgi:hypothetical protein